MPLETDLLEYLKAGPGVQALVSDRVWPNVRPQGSAYPAVTIQRVSGGRMYADDGEVGLTIARVQVSSWGTSYTDAKGLAFAVAARLSATRDVTQGATTFLYITLENELDLREGGSGQAEYLHQIVTDFDVLCTN